MSDNNDLGRMIRGLRLALEMTQVDLAKRAGIEQTYISQIELGKANTPSYEVLWKLADALGTTEVDLLKAAGKIRPHVAPTPPLPPQLQVIHRDIENLPPERRERRLKALTLMYRALQEAE